MKKIVSSVVIFLVYVTLAGVVVFLVRRPREAKPGENGAPPEASVNVVVKTVEPAAMPDVILLPASVEAAKSVTVAAEVAGAVEWLGVEEGARVKEGQQIAKIDIRTLKAVLDQAQASYELAKNDADRGESLFGQNIMSKEQYEGYKIALRVREAQLEVAKVSFEKGTIVSPVTGVLNKRYAEVGEYVKPGDSIAEIVQVDTVKVVVDIPEKDVGYVKLGTVLGVVANEQAAQAPRATASGGADYSEALRQAVADKTLILGNVTYRSVVADPKTRTYRVEVTVPNSDQQFLPGMIVRTALLRRIIPDAIAAPLVAVVPRDGRAVVYVENKSRAHERTVALGITDGTNIQITDGLAAGDRLIVDGQRQLRDGTLVKVVEPGGAAQ